MGVDALNYNLLINLKNQGAVPSGTVMTVVGPPPPGWVRMGGVVSGVVPPTPTSPPILSIPSLLTLSYAPASMDRFDVVMSLPDGRMIAPFGSGGNPRFTIINTTTGVQTSTADWPAGMAGTNFTYINGWWLISATQFVIVDTYGKAAIYDVSTNTWSTTYQLASSYQLVWNSPVTVMGDGKVMFHCYNNSQAQYAVYDPATKTMGTATSYPGGSYCYGARTMTDGKVYMFMYGTATHGYIYNPGTQTWSSQIAGVNLDNGWSAAHRAYPLSDNRMVVLGGNSTVGGYDIAVLSGTTWTLYTLALSGAPSTISRNTRFFVYANGDIGFFHYSIGTGIDSVHRVFSYRQSTPDNGFTNNTFPSGINIADNAMHMSDGRIVMIPRNTNATANYLAVYNPANGSSSIWTTYTISGVSEFRNAGLVELGENLLAIISGVRVDGSNPSTNVLISDLANVTTVRWDLTTGTCGLSSVANWGGRIWAFPLQGTNGKVFICNSPGAGCYYSLIVDPVLLKSILLNYCKKL